MIEGLFALDTEEWTLHASTPDKWAYLCDPHGAQLMNGLAGMYKSNLEGETFTCPQCLALLAAKTDDR